MKLVTFEVDGGKHIGALVDGGIVDLTAATGISDMRAFLEGGEKSMSAAKEAVAAKKPLVAGSPKLLAPITGCEKVLCIGMNYVDHCTEQNFPIPTEPVVFNKFASCIVGDGDDIALSPETNELDFEVELVIVIGEKARSVKKEDAMKYVAGYTVAHDVSARDWQLKKNGGQWLLGKAMDGFAPIGPCIVTPDSLSDPHKLGLRCIVNGETLQDSNTDQLIFKTGELIEFVTRFMTLVPGDIIMTGTPPGVGVFRKPPIFLKKGDVVTCEIDEIGKITNKIV